MNDNITCAVNSECSASQARCVCSKNFTSYGNSCGKINFYENYLAHYKLKYLVPDAYLLPSNGKCFSDSDCPPFAKCFQSVCYCFENHILVNGICGMFYNLIKFMQRKFIS